MTAPTAQKISTLSDRELKAWIARMLAAHPVSASEREARFRRLPTPGSQFRADAEDRLPITAGDVAVFCLPTGLAAGMVLLAHWAGYLT